MLPSPFVLKYFAHSIAAQASLNSHQNSSKAGLTKDNSPQLPRYVSVSHTSKKTSTFFLFAQRPVRISNLFTHLRLQSWIRLLFDKLRDNSLFQDFNPTRAIICSYTVHAMAAIMVLLSARGTAPLKNPCSPCSWHREDRGEASGRIINSRRLKCKLQWKAGREPTIGMKGKRDRYHVDASYGFWSPQL